MITIHQELENYSISKVLQKCYYYLSTFGKSSVNHHHHHDDKKQKNLISHQTEFSKNHNNCNHEIENEENNNCNNTKLKNRENHNNNNSNEEEKEEGEEQENLIIKNNNTNTIKKKTKYSLITYDEAPEHLKRQYLLYGYRSDFSVWLAFKSIFIYGHNDFSNIHTHLIPAIYFMITLYGILFNGDYGFEKGDKIVFTIFIGSAITTFIFSCLYHTFGACSLCAYSKLLLCDYLGIILLIGSSFFPPLYYTYRIESIELMYFYMGTITLLCTCLGFMVTLPSLQNKNTLRNVLFCSTALFGIIPAVHSIWFHSLANVGPYFIKLLSLFAVYGMGLIFYIFRIPESIFPGNPTLTSHSIWHIFVSYGTYLSFTTSLSLFELFPLPPPATTAEAFLKVLSKANETIVSY